MVFYGSHSLHSLCGLPARDVSGSGDQATIMVFCRWLAFLGEVPMSLYDRVLCPDLKPEQVRGSGDNPLINNRYRPEHDLENCSFRASNE